MRTHDLPRLSFTEGELLQARIELTEFVHLMADQTKERLGFGWTPHPDAPNTWRALKTAWQHSLATREPLPVFDGGSDAVIFAGPEANWAYRFWHDVTHLERGRDFTSPHELDMAVFHLWEAERHGLERGSLPWRLLHADAVGQVLHWAVRREFLIDQRAFIVNYLRFGVEDAVLAEMARTGQLAPQVLPIGIDITTAAETPVEPTHWTART
ncbi:hypothetical protein AB2L57_05730 [Microbacterium sp. HA-8]|uniref:hypothetical protein n=1 Tax=Microbacterium sp. HA-8 TaxID=3234200 RepID=UPI0038F76546